ncbi:MAG: glycosyltransferase [Desulfomonilaceae bacterium]
MRILHLIPHLSGGGAERQLSYLAPEMALLGHEVQIAYLYDGPEPASHPKVCFHRLTVSGHHNPVLFLKLLRLVRSVKPHIVQSWIPMMDTIAGLISLTTKIVWVLRESSSDTHYRSFNLKQELRSRLGRKASAVIANSPAGSSYWLGKGFPTDRLFVIPNAIPFDTISRIKPVEHTSEKRKILIYAGRLITLKNVDVIIKAIAMSRHRERLVLYIAGEGPEELNLQSLVAQLELTDTIKFLGFLPSRDLWPHVKAADAFISLSEHEGMPNSACEAVACGIPVILSDIPAHRSLFDDNSALLIPSDSPAEAAKAITHTFDNPRDAAERATRALHMTKNRTTTMTAAKYIQLYENLLPGSKKK